jgi:hypothetical protein
MLTPDHGILQSLGRKARLEVVSFPAVKANWTRCMYKKGDEAISQVTCTGKIVATYERRPGNPSDPRPTW